MNLLESESRDQREALGEAFHREKLLMPDPGFVRCLGIFGEMPSQTGPSEEARLRCILSPLQMKRAHSFGTPL